MSIKRDSKGRFINGHVVPIVLKRKLSRLYKGKHFSPETEFKKGMTPWHKGTKGMKKAWNKGLTIDTDKRVKKNIESTTKTKRRLFKEGKLQGPRKGAKFSKETIKKMIYAQSQRPTGLEKKFLEIINKHSLPYKYVGDWSFKIGRCNPDFININSKKIAIEVYTKYHKLRRHATVEQWKQERIEKFKEYGWNIIFFDETQVNEKFVLEQIAAKGDWT